MPATSAGMTATIFGNKNSSDLSLEGAVTKPNSDAPVLCEVDGRGVAQVVLNRPERNNAYDGALIQALLATLGALAARRGLRAVVISGRGRHFQAGADLKWIDAVRAASREENIALSRATAQAIWRLNAAPVPTVALVQGACFGGGTGLIAACDVVVAADDANFSIAEVRWGLTAAIIIPQLNEAIGVRQVRRYALTGERFSAAEARRIGLVHEIVPAAELAAAGARIVDQVLQNGPQAIAETKALALQSAWTNSAMRRRAARSNPRRQAPLRRGRRRPRLLRRKARRAVGMSSWDPTFPARGAARSGAPQMRDRRELGPCYDPGSAAHHCVLRCAPETGIE